MSELLPYSFTMNTPQLVQGDELSGFQGVHFTVDGDAAWLLAKLEQWFSNRDDVILIDHGTTATGLGFIIMEWEEHEIDPLFLAILQHEDVVQDYSVYTRDDEEGEE